MILSRFVCFSDHSDGVPAAVRARAVRQFWLQGVRHALQRVPRRHSALHGAQRSRTLHSCRLSPQVRHNNPASRLTSWISCQDLSKILNS